MIFLLTPANCLKKVAPSSLARPSRFLSLFKYQPTIPLQHQRTISLHQLELNMPKEKGKEITRSGFQLKTPKGTVDNFGKEAILLDQVTYELVTTGVTSYG